MKRSWSIVLLVWLLAACHPIKVPVIPPTPPTPATMNVHVQVNDGEGKGIPGATARVQNGTPEVYSSCVTDPTGHCYVTVPAVIHDSGLRIEAPEGYLSIPDFPVVVERDCTLTVTLKTPHVDPMVFSLAQLAAIRGAMWTVPGPWAYGPRPGQPDNITALEFIQSYGNDPAHLNDTQKAMLAKYKSEGYTHVAYGPPDGNSYHGMYPDINFLASKETFEVWLDWLQVFWDNGLMPVIFLHGDGETFEQTRDKYRPFLEGNARAKRLMRIIVPAGWEPTRYDWSSRTWGLFFDWARAEFPSALILAHTVPDVDAMVGTDALYDDNGKGNDKGWAYIAPKIHGWLVQTSAFEDPTAQATPTTTRWQEWQKLWDKNERASYYNRFHNGYAGWPTGSLWGPTTPIKIYAGEYCSYWVYWKGRKYSECVAWGNEAMRLGADGYFDGGSVPVLAQVKKPGAKHRWYLLWLK